MFDIGTDILPYVVGLGAVIVAVWIVKQYFRQHEVYPRDVVILHQPTRGPWAPSLSPFPIKLETYLRMAKIPYKNHFTLKLSSKGKMPWITYNGLDMGDSQLCIEFLNRTLGKDFSSHLSKQEQAIARAFQMMTEDHLYWSLLIHRWINKDTWQMTKERVAKNLGFVFQLIFPYIARVEAWGQGMGRHPIEITNRMGVSDMEALSEYLGDKAYFTGAEPCEVDCAIFGMLATLKYHFWDSPYNKVLREKPNLAKFCERMQERFWPDWDECNTAGNTKEATK